MTNNKEILKNLDEKYHNKFEYKYETSHKIYLDNVMLFSIDDSDIIDVSPSFDMNCLWRQVDILQSIVFPASLKYESEDLDEYDKKCLFTLAFVYMLNKVFLKGV